ncbi:energy transducer TonB [Microbulbifer sp. TRSA007]|uniref:energy transducer TonB n=1 Tax=Microbulbifer sp. TRSA007 TaxID=3243384 RepID=UPI00403A74FA
MKVLLQFILLILISSCATQENMEHTRDVACSEKRKEQESTWHQIHRVRCYLHFGRVAEAKQQLEVATLSIAHSPEDEQDSYLTVLNVYQESIYSGKYKKLQGDNHLIDGDFWLIQKSKEYYPRDALEKKIEGYVLVEFTIGINGEVKDAIVLESKPAGIFDRTALFSVSNDKYLPRVIDGKAYEVTGVRSRINFGIPEESVN